MRSRLIRRRKFSEIQTNIELNEQGWFSVVIPAGRENLIKNPSLETNANGYVAKGGTIARTDDWQSHGAISLAIAPTAGVNDGFYYDDPNHDFDVVENTLYWPSFDFRGDGGRKYKAYVATQYGGVQIGAAKPFTATGNRQRIEFPYREGDNTLVDNLMAYWKLGEATAATRLDSVGNNDLTPAGGANPGPSQTTGIIGNGAQFTSANSERLSVADSTDLSAGNIDFTIAAWVYLDTKAASMDIVSKGTADSIAGREYNLFYFITDDRIRFQISNGAAGSSVVATNFGSPPTGTWLFVVAWYDSVNDQLGISVNGSTETPVANATGSQDTAGSFFIGSNQTPGIYWNGRIDEVGFWKKVLSSAERTSLYNGGFGQTYNFLQRRLYVVKDNETNTRPFYVDGLQFEAGDFPTTLLIGDMVGLIPNFVDYYWTGAPNASTSVRVANSADGGRVMNLRQLGLRVKSHVGLGMIGLLAITTPLGNGGSFPQGVTNTEVNFNIIGEISGDEYQTLDMYEQALVDAFNPKRVSPWQPCKILYEPLDDCGNSIGETLEIAAIPDGEFMPLQTDNLNTRVLALPFKRYLPFVAKNVGEQGTTLSYQDGFYTVGQRLIWVDENGDFYQENFNGVINDIIKLPDGTWAVAGNFLNAGGDANADYLARFDPSTRTISAFNETPLSAQVRTLLLLPDGNLAVGGDSLNAGGDANADYLFKLDLTTGLFSSFNATPLSALVNILVLLPDGNVAAGGNFLNAGGDANADYLLKLTISTGAYSSFNATPLSGQVYTAVVDASNTRLVIGGIFLNAGGDANADWVCYVILATGAFASLTSSNPLNGDVNKIVVTPSGDLFLATLATDAGGNTSADYAIGFNGISFYNLGQGLDNGSTKVFRIGDSHYLFAGSGFSILGPTYYALAWVGSSWIPADFTGLTNPALNALLVDQSRIAYGFGTSVSTVTSKRTTIENPGDTSYPTYRFRGPGTLVSLKNLTNGGKVYFNCTLLAGEDATLRFSHSGATFGSNLRPNLLSTILPGSNTNFRLSPGDNMVSLFISYVANELNDGGNRLSNYLLQGVTTLNSDNGRLYVNVVDLGVSRRIDIYKDSARTQLVAQSSTYSGSGNISVSQSNASGIAGQIEAVNMAGSDLDIIIDVPLANMSFDPSYASLSSAVRPRVF